jgi:CarboxypepD_reg-like domain/TonB-dependent Receptor Plug Domain
MKTQVTDIKETKTYKNNKPQIMKAKNFFLIIISIVFYINGTSLESYSQTSKANDLNYQEVENINSDDNSTAIESVTLSGYLKDESDGEVLIGATIYVTELGIGGASNVYGYYSIVVPEGIYNLEFSYIGYETKAMKVELLESKKMNIMLSDQTQELDEIVVLAEKKNKNVESIEMSKVKMPVKMVKKLPAFMGEVDIIKSIQMLPGIQSGGEGSSGLYVRGGGPDENLLVLDEAPVYNASHLMGFFSVFNSDVIKDIQVYKGGIPSMYGGKASSVIDIRMKDGNNQSFHGTGGIGSISSRLTLEGPIIKDKWSYIISGRRTYADVVGKLVGIESLKENKLYFYDLNGKTNIQLSDKDKLFASVYTGDDFFELGESLYMRWGNLTSTVRWNHVFGDRLFSNTSIIYSKYNYNLGVPGDGAEQFDWSSKIRDYNLKEDFTYFMNPNNKISFGFNSIYHHFEPGKFDVNSNSYFSTMELTHYNALDNDIYLSNEQKIGSLLTLQYGFRYSIFQQIGQGQVREYLDPENPTENEVVNIKEYTNRDFIGKPYTNLQPRLAIKYSTGVSSSVKASYNRMVQNLHLISNTNSPTPLDIWLPSNKYIKPLIVDQVALGYFRNFMNDAIETSVEVYYKDMQNVIDYKDGAELFLNEDLETEILEGKGHSYGLEMLIKKQQGKFTGWASYTLAKTMREIPGINGGKAYPSSYDRTHDISLIGSYEINKYWTVSANWLFTTGNATSYPVSKYNVQGNELYVYADRNSYRIPNYHRLDLSANYDFKKNDSRKYKQSINISFINAYAHKNAYSVSFRQNEDNPNVSEAVRLSIIGSVIPSITYNFSF